MSWRRRVEKYRYFALKNDGKIYEYYRVWGDEYEWWDENVLGWIPGYAVGWAQKLQNLWQSTISTIIEETSPLEMVVLLGKEAVRMLQ